MKHYSDFVGDPVSDAVGQMGGVAVAGIAFIVSAIMGFAIGAWFLS